MLSKHHNTKRLKSFSMPSQGQKHISSILPPLQGSLPKNKGSSGNNFSRRIFQRGLKNLSSFKTSFFLKKIDPENFWQKFFEKLFFGVENWKIANCLKRVLPKFRADPSFAQGVNGRLKFRKNSKFASWCSKGNVRYRIRARWSGSYVTLHCLPGQYHLLTALCLSSFGVPAKFF